METQRSSKRITDYSKVLRKNCSKQFKLIAVLSGLSAFLCIFHFISVGTLRFDYMDNFYNYGKKFSLAAALAGVLLVPPVFKELYNRQFADVEFSLPLSAAERFKAKLLVLVKCHFIPFVISQAAVALTALTLIPSGQLKIVMLDIICSLVNMLFTDAIALICVSSCGHIVECIYTPVLLAAASSLIFPLGLFKLVILLSGRNTNTTNFLNIPIGYPGFYDLIYDPETSSYSARIANSDSGTVITWFVMLLVNIAICVGLIMLAYRIYRKRNGLSVDKPIVFGAFFHIFRTIVAVAVILLFFMNSLYIAVFVGLLLFLGISVSAKRRNFSMKDLESCLLGFCGCIVSILAIGFVSYMTCGFGYASMKTDKVFDSPKADCTVDLITERYYYRVYLLPKDFKNQSYFSNLPDYRFADKEKTDQLYKEINSLDKRHSLSFTENLSNYLNMVRFENGHGEFEVRTGYVQIRCNLDDMTHNFTYSDSFLTNGLSEEEILAEVQKLLNMGYEVIRTDPTGQEDTYLMKEKRYEHRNNDEEESYTAE